MCTYDLKYSDYDSSVSDGLRSLLATSDISDITLAVEGKFFKAHQVILSIFSPYFRELFCVNPSKHTIFFMKNVKYRIMHNLLAFMYEGKVQIPEEDFNLFWETASELKIKGLSNNGEPHSEAKISHIAVESAPVVGIKAQQSADVNSPKLASCLKRPAESVQASPAGAIIKKSKVGAQVPHEAAPGVHVLASAVPSTSWDPEPLECVQEILPIIVNVTGNASIAIKEEGNSCSEEDDLNYCTQNEDAINLDGSDGDATFDVKWEPEIVPVSTLLDPLGEINVRFPGVNEGHSEMSGKTKRKFVPIKEKLEALKRIDQGETLKKIAVDYGVGVTTVGDWRRYRSKIEKFSTVECVNVSSNRKSMKKSDYERTSEALFHWFSEQRQKGSPISGPILQEKALFFRHELAEGEEDFTASAGWLDRWKKRYGIRQLEICDEKLLQTQYQ